jgi:glycosyltransferase involved in cell wall biosynthesis
VPATSLSVLVPVYDEQHLVATSLARLEVLRDCPHLERVQVVVVDDSSRDATPDVLRAFAAERGIVLAPASSASPRGATPPSATLRGAGRHGGIDWVFLRHDRNGGKGTAVRTALARADCELSVIHDADLEYHPRDLLRIVKVFVEEGADAVFGSRFASCSGTSSGTGSSRSSRT